MQTIADLKRAARERLAAKERERERVEAYIKEANDLAWKKLAERVLTDWPCLAGCLKRPEEFPRTFGENGYSFTVEARVPGHVPVFLSYLHAEGAWGPHKGQYKDEYISVPTGWRVMAQEEYADVNYVAPMGRDAEFADLGDALLFAEGQKDARDACLRDVPQALRVAKAREEKAEALRQTPDEQLLAALRRFVSHNAPQSE